MKRSWFIIAASAVFASFLYIGSGVLAQSERWKAETKDVNAPNVSPNLVISQIYGGGGNSNAVFANDFVELFNRGNSPVSLDGWSTQYASSGGSEFLVTPLSNITIQPGQYYLIQYASSGSIGGPIPTPDRIAPAVTNNAGNTFTPNLSGTTGKIALVNSTVRLPISTCPVDSTIVDFVGYGDAASCFEGARAGNFSNSTAGRRNGNGCTDTDNNSADFSIGVPAPRNTSSFTNSCNLGANLQAGMAANPATVSPGGTTLLTVTVIPATTPPSTGIGVEGNLTAINGLSIQPFYDNGTNGDVTAGDNVFSFLASIPAGTSGGQYVITSVAHDAQGRTVNLDQTISVNAPLPNEDPLIFGNPSYATTDVSNENNYLMEKPQFSLSYNRSTATPNWVAWRLDSSWIGTADRQDDFRPDPALPAAWYHVQDNDYSGSGFSRGHMCPSGDRTRSIPDNSATFLMTNMIPQLAANNEGPWNDLENYCRTLASQGNEVYIISGPNGIHAVTPTIANGQITVPERTWKVVLVLSNGSDDLRRVNRSTRVFGIVVSNRSVTNGNAWRNYRVTVDAVESLTGHNFFSNVPRNIQEYIESRRDTL